MPLPDNPLQPTLEKPSANPWLSWPMAVLVLLVAGFSFAVRQMGSQMTNLHFIYHQTANGWDQVRTPAGYPEMIRVTSGGTVWARTFGTAVFARWDGKKWRYFQNREIGVRSGSEDRDFAIDGEDLWAPTAEGVLHFDGQRWRCYQEAAASEGASIVAGGGEVWVIDPAGKLSHFVAGKWKNEKLPAAKPANADRTPRLARTVNGTVWLAWQGLWRWDGGNWLAVTEDADLIGAAGDRVWLSGRRSGTQAFRSVSLDGKHWDSYPPSQTGIENPLDVAAAGGKTWFATPKGLVEFDGATWRTLPLASKELSGYRAATVGPGGDLWLIGTPTPETLRAFRRMVPVMLLAPVAVIALVVWMYWRSRRRRLRQHQLVSSAVQHATG